MPTRYLLKDFQKPSCVSPELFKEHRVKISYSGPNSLRVTIPKPIAEFLNLRAGDHVSVKLATDKIVIKKEEGN